MAPKGDGIPIIVGDIIKVGWIKFKVWEMKMQKLEGTFSENSENLRDSEFASPEQIDIHFVERASAGD